MSFSDYLRSDSSSSQNTPSVNGSNRDSNTLDKPGPSSASHQQGQSSDSHSLPFSFEHDRQQSGMGIGPATFSNQINFQMPPYILGGPPSIPPDGGAEVMHGMLPSPSSNVLPANGWFVNDFMRYGDSVPMLNQASYQNSGSLDPSAANPSSSNMYRTFSQSQEQSTSYNEQSAMNVDAAGPALSPPYSTNDNPPVVSPKPPAAFQLDTFNPTNPIDPTKVGIPTNVQPLLYSASGFDVLGILAKVATRPKPKIVLGPVDFTCSFCFVDVRRYDHPIVYASPTFYKLTGYAEHEILGKNCRFLQSPDGSLERGVERKFTSPEAVQHLKKSLVSNKECQASLINYRKGGQAFINLITVIPVPGDDSDEIAYQVGFQVDLTEQPSAILQRLNDGSYIVNYSASVGASSSGYRDRSRVISKELRYVLSNGQPSPIPKPEQDRISLNSFLLENSEDFVHVLSLKGLFQYVSPSVRKVLDYDAEELIGKSISDICHPADITPVIRELKESSTHIAPPPEAGSSVQPTLKTVNLLFRARTKSSGYVWIESHGQLHVEPGKGRKSIILVGRLRLMPKLHWETVDRAGGFSENEFWGLVSPHGLWLKVGMNMSRVLDRPVTSLVGSSLLEMIPRPDHKSSVAQALYEAAFPTGSMSDKDSVHRQVELSPSQSTRLTADIVFYTRESAGPVSNTLAAVPVVCQIKILDPASSEAVHHSRGHLLSKSSSSNTSLLSNQLPAINVFEELDTTRHTSWQYELTHLKIANKNLLSDIVKMEVKHGLRPPPPAVSDAPPQSATDEQQHPDTSSIDPRPTKKRPRTYANRNQDGQS